MTTPYIAPILVQNGFIGVTGTTPYRPSATAQVSTLQYQYANALAGQAITRANGAVHINLNFDGTQNNREYVVSGESQTNVASVYDLQRNAGNETNTFYYSGIGAQTVPSGTLLPNGSIDPRSSSSDLQSTPWRAGELGNEIIDRAYRRLAQHVADILVDNPNAQIAINLTGFSRGGAEAVAFANLVNERGIPGLYPPGAVPINSMVLYDPVSQTGGALDVRWPTNLSNPALVFVATAENRIWFPSMPVGTNAIVVPIEGVHSDVGGSFNPEGISAVTLKITRDYLEATGSPVAEIPSNLQPDWGRMYNHNSAIDNYDNVMMPTIGDPLQTVGTNRYYEGTGLGSVTVKDALGRDFKSAPLYEMRNGRLVLVGFNRQISSNTTDPDTGGTTQTTDVTAYAIDGVTIRGRSFTSSTADATGQLTDKLVVTYGPDGATVRSTSLTERLPNNSLLTTNRDALGSTTSTVELQRFDDSTGLQTTRYTNGRTEILATNSDGIPDSLRTTTRTANNTEQIDSYSYDSSGRQTQQLSRTVQTFYDENGTSRLETVTTYPGGIPTTVSNAYDTDGRLTSSTPVENPAAAQVLGQRSVTTLNDIAGLIGAIQGGRPLPILNSGLHLINNIANPAGTVVQKYRHGHRQWLGQPVQPG